MARYKLTQFGSVQDMIRNCSIPADPANTDYAEYLQWVDEGNTADDADPEPDPEAGMTIRQKVKRRLFLEYDAQEIQMALIEKEAGDATAFNAIKARALAIKAELL